MDELRERGEVSLETRRLLAAEAYSHTAAYDATIAQRLAKNAGLTFPDELTLSLRKVRDLRYGENPHQQAAFYALHGETGAMTTSVKIRVIASAAARSSGRLTATMPPNAETLSQAKASS